jgi:hypothetical protein
MKGFIFMLFAAKISIVRMINTKAIAMAMLQ